MLSTFLPFTEHQELPRGYATLGIIWTDRDQQRGLDHQGIGTDFPGQFITKGYFRTFNKCLIRHFEYTYPD